MKTFVALLCCVGKNKMKYAIAVAVLLFASVAQADTFLQINATSIELGTNTLDLSMEVDQSTGQVLDESMSWVGGLQGQQFSLFTQSPTLWNWYDPALDVYLQLGYSDFPTTFPTPGTYNSNLFNMTCEQDSCLEAVGGGYVEGYALSGSILVTDPPGTVPEPSALLLLGIGLAALLGWKYAR